MAGQDADAALAFGGQDQRLACHDLRYYPRADREHQEDQREPHVDREHHDHGAGHVADGHEQTQQTGLQHFAGLVQIVGHAADDASGLMRVEVLERQPGELGAHLIAQLEVQSFGEAGHDEGLRRVEHPLHGVQQQQSHRLDAAVHPRDRERLAGCKGGLDLVPQQVEQIRGVDRSGQRDDDVEHE